MVRRNTTDLDAVQSVACGIYAIHSPINGRAYVGSSYNISVRWDQHRSRLLRGKHRNPHLQNAWNKYGEEAFEFIVLEECPVELLIEREQHHIDAYSDKYNIAPVAGSQLGARRSAETRAKMSAAQSGRKLSDEARANISKSKMGNTYRLGIKHTEETKAKISASKMGRKMSPEARENMSVARIGNTNAKGYVATAEHRANLSAAVKASWDRRRGTDADGD